MVGVMVKRASTTGIMAAYLLAEARMLRLEALEINDM
jgi:hypothetical protein